MTALLSAAVVASRHEAACGYRHSSQDHVSHKCLHSSPPRALASQNFAVRLSPGIGNDRSIHLPSVTLRGAIGPRNVRFGAGCGRPLRRITSVLEQDHVGPAAVMLPPSARPRPRCGLRALDFPQSRARRQRAGRGDEPRCSTLRAARCARPGEVARHASRQPPLSSPRRRQSHRGGGPAPCDSFIPCS